MTALMTRRQFAALCAACTLRTKQRPPQAKPADAPAAERLVDPYIEAQAAVIVQAHSLKTVLDRVCDLEPEGYHSHFRGCRSAEPDDQVWANLVRVADAADFVLDALIGEAEMYCHPVVLRLVRARLGDEYDLAPEREAKS